MLRVILSYITICIIISLYEIESKKPSSKRLLSVWQIECELGMIADPECPIDGCWSPWGQWSPCQGACDDVGHRRRTRECTNPAPAQDGAPCIGSDEQEESCYLTNCTVDDFRKLVAGDTARIKALRHLEAVPALMERCLQMECPYEAIEAALIVDNTWQLDSESLWNALQCVSRYLGCPVAGEWGDWGSWSTCGARCGEGLRWRLRRCDTPPPSEYSLVCTGTPLQAEHCIGDQCAISSHDSGGSWGEWSSWSACSEICGPGVRRRRRVCHETNTPHASGTWGTHCRGQHDQLEVCENQMCNFDGGWSGWGRWGPCSHTCGAGKRSRTRSCTRPLPAGKGKPCVGPRTEVGSCHLVPCEGFSHKVALFQGESYLHYDFINKRAALFQFYIRFMPLSPHGTLVHRSAGDDSYIRLSLQKWHICLDACASSHSCCLPRSCIHSSIEPAAWHSVLVTVTIEGAMVRLNDAPVSLRSAWPCEPDLPDNKLNIYVGEKLQGQVQEIIMNFIPLKLFINRDHKRRNFDFSPTSAANIAYDQSSTTEAYLRIKDDHYLRLPCFENQDEWILQLTLKPKREAGTVIFLKNDQCDNWLHVDFQNTRLKVKLALGDYRSESSSTIEYPPDRWLDVILRKKQATNAIEVSINAGERLHVQIDEDVVRMRRYYDKTYYLPKTELNISKRFVMFSLCTDEFFIGGVPNEVKQIIQEDFTPFSGVLASAKVNYELLDLYDYSVERYKDNKVQVSSKTASVSGSYHEIAWGKSSHLNLTCLHARTTRSPHTATWLLLDTSFTDVFVEKTIRSVDDGRILRLVSSAENDLKGFFTCRAHRIRFTRNVVTYGVLGKIPYKLHGPDLTTAIAVMTTVSLVVGTLLWLVVEGYHDLRQGYGFFRDAHLTPEQEAEAVCRYIDQNINLISSKNAAKLAKAKARRVGRHLAAGRTSFAAQEPQGLIEERMHARNQLESISSELALAEGVATLPVIKSSRWEPTHDVYRCEPCYISSPRHGSISSSHPRVTSSTSFELVSPRVLCSKLLMSKGTRSSKDSGYSKKKDKSRSLASAKGVNMSSLVTIKSSSYVQPTPVQKVLRRFQELKGNDY